MEPEIRVEMDQLNLTIERLANVTDNLTNRLSPILRSEPEDNCKDGCSINTRTSLGSAIRSYNERIDRLVNALGRIEYLLEL